MIYVLISIDEIYINKCRFNSNFKLDENMLEVTQEEFDDIKLPCRYENGKFIECKMPVIEEAKAEASDVDKLQADVDMIKIEMGLF